MPASCMAIIDASAVDSLIIILRRCHEVSWKFSFPKQLQSDNQAQTGTQKFPLLLPPHLWQ
ncbi:hypothetical protein [Chlorogloea sp. CCALA 695]|uniref:hypothetical protein n=2 Tax=Chlorogloea sp. CCALA 695 TaxID=2107693 RepID=UPI0011B24483|nr:hypothetical protein [Chlorogloea sp. CCALA 695]